mgnify:CR=1 FL=1
MLAGLVAELLQRADAPEKLREGQMNPANWDDYADEPLALFTGRVYRTLAAEAQLPGRLALLTATLAVACYLALALLLPVHNSHGNMLQLEPVGSVSAGQPMPAFAVVLIGPMLWTRFEGNAGGVTVIPHAAGPAPGDVVGHHPVAAAAAVEEAGFFGRLWTGLKQMLGMA